MDKNEKIGIYKLFFKSDSTPLTGLLVFCSVIICLCTNLQSIGLFNGDGLNAFLVLGLIFSILYYLFKLNLTLSTDYLICIFLSLFVAVFNFAPYMISLTVVFLLLMIVDVYGDLIDFQKVFKVYFSLSLFMFVCIVISYFIFGFNADNDVSMWRFDRIIDRSALGFIQPNSAEIKWFVIVLSAIGVYSNRFIYFAFLNVSLLVYHYTLSRTSTLILVGCLLFLFFLGPKQNAKVPSFIKSLLSLTPLFLLFISLTFILSRKYSVKLDNLLSGRLTLYNDFYQSFGIHFLRVPELETAMFDNSYLQALLSKGILFCFVLMLVYIIIGRFSKKLNWKGETFFVAVCVLALLETSLQHFDLIFPLIMLIGQSQSETTKGTFTLNNSSHSFYLLS